MSSANHWAAWWISDDMWRSHGQPLAEQFCDDICEAYLRPALRQEGYEDWRNVIVDFDASAVVVNPDRSKDADQAMDRGEIGGKGYRVMKNIPEAWAPTEEERRIFLAMKKVFLDEDGNPIEAGPTPRTDVDPNNPNPGDEPGPPDGQPGETSEGTNLPASAMQVALQMALFRCRELAGSRIRSRASSCPECMTAVDGVEHGLVAFTLGSDGLDQIGIKEMGALVSGGAEILKATLRSWGNDDTSATAIARLVEQHAARTLLQESPSLSPLAALELAA